MNRKWDKISAGATLALSIIWFFVEKLTGFFTYIGAAEINSVIPFIAVLSVFCMVWSFIWDGKISDLNKKIQAYESYFLEKSHLEKEELKELMVAGITKPTQTESRILFEHETNLNQFLSLNSSSSEYALIYVITNDAGVENDDFGDAICQNIINNHQYVYMTPLTDAVFIEKLRDTLFRVKPNNVDIALLNAAICKNIRHIQNTDIFDILPKYTDMVLYKKKHVISYSTNITSPNGYYSFQNGPITSHGVKCYYYSQMENEHATRIINFVEALLKSEKKIDLSSSNYLSNKVTIKNNRLYCTEKISRGEVFFKKGGRFILKKDLDSNLFSSARYIQVSTDYVVSSLSFHEDKNFGFPIRHNCRHPNCYFVSPVEIAASEDIIQDEEILIDYAYFDPDYKRFNCDGCAGRCTRKEISKEDLAKQLNDSDILERISPYLKENIIGGK